MSADNVVIILHTKEQFVVEGINPDGSPYSWKNLFEKRIDAYRVAHTQGFDNFEWYKKNQPYMIGHYLIEIFRHSRIFYDYEEARKEAEKLHDSKQYVEYGISLVDATEYDLSSY
jgi:hypothetical protein